MKEPPAVVFTDLDGTLLDHHTYDFSPAREALAALQQRTIPLILCSSKTRAELYAIQADLGLQGPYIPENGGAVCLSGGGDLARLLPDRLAGGCAKVFGTPYRRLREMFVALREQRGLGWRGFGDVDTRTIGAWTGLPPEQAVLAQARDFDEPFLWEPEPSPALVAEVDAALAAAGLRLTRGGRFWHLTGVNDKGRAVRWLLHALTTCWGEEPRSLGLGDSENDLPMLEAVGRGIFVERPGRGHLVPRPEGIDVVKGVGPVGWNRAVLEWLENIRS